MHPVITSGEWLPFPLAVNLKMRIEEFAKTNEYSTHPDVNFAYAVREVHTQEMNSGWSYQRTRQQDAQRFTNKTWFDVEREASSRRERLDQDTGMTVTHPFVIEGNECTFQLARSERWKIIRRATIFHHKVMWSQEPVKIEKLECCSASQKKQQKSTTQSGIQHLQAMFERDERSTSSAPQGTGKKGKKIDVAKMRGLNIAKMMEGLKKGLPKMAPPKKKTNTSTAVEAPTAPLEEAPSAPTKEPTNTRVKFQGGRRRRKKQDASRYASDIGTDVENGVEFAGDVRRRLATMERLVSEIEASKSNF